MRIYISGAFTAQERLQPWANALRRLGHDIVSSWLWEAAKPDHLSKDTWDHLIADKDIAETYASDCVILDLDGESTGGGRYVEWGIACCPGSMRMRITVGDDRRNGIFLSKAHFHFNSWADLVRCFNALYLPR